MASAVEQAYNVGLEALVPAGSRNAASGQAYSLKLKPFSARGRLKDGANLPFI